MFIFTGDHTYSYLQADAEENEPTSFVFISGDLYTNEDKLLLLIHGSGAVRAGQWARRYINYLTIILNLRTHCTNNALTSQIALKGEI